MKFYKLINSDNEYIGVASSKDFVEYIKKSGYFLTAGEVNGQFVLLNAQLYRDTWMKVLPDQPINYQQVRVMEIEEKEYTTLHDLEEQARNDEEFVPNYEPFIPVDEEIIPEYHETDTISELTLNRIRELKIQALSKVCHETIEAGFDIELRGEVKHFSLDTQDQLNLMTLGTLTSSQSLIPYHADGEECKFYSANEINSIITAANQHKIYHTTYYNALKQYVNTLETRDEITAVEYGDEIPEELKTAVLKAVEEM